MCVGMYVRCVETLLPRAAPWTPGADGSTAPMPLVDADACESSLEYAAASNECWTAGRNCLQIRAPAFRDTCAIRKVLQITSTAARGRERPSGVQVNPARCDISSFCQVHLCLYTV